MRVVVVVDFGERDWHLRVGQSCKVPVLILDEPTAALDPESERAVVATLAARKHRRLVFVIAHRLTTIASADWVLFLEQGRIVEQGPPEELRRRDGPFRRFATLQEG